MLWEVKIRPAAGEVDREGLRIVHEATALGVTSIRTVAAARLFLLQGALTEADVHRAAETLLVDPIVETAVIRPLGATEDAAAAVTVLFKAGVTDNVAQRRRRRWLISALPSRWLQPVGTTLSTPRFPRPMCTVSPNGFWRMMPSNG